MKHSLRFRRALRWAAAAICLFSGATILATLRFVYVRAVDWANCFFAVGDGTIVLRWPEEYFGAADGAEVTASVFVQQVSAIEKPAPGRLVDWPLLPMAGVDKGLYYIVAPLWIPFAAFGIASGLLWWRDRPFAAGHCRVCGYDLTGNVSRRCPECGTELGVPPK